MMDLSIVFWTPADIDLDNFNRKFPLLSNLPILPDRVHDDVPADQECPPVVRARWVWLGLLNGDNIPDPEPLAE